MNIELFVDTKGCNRKSIVFHEESKLVQEDFESVIET